MDKRFFLALFLSLIAIAVSQLLFPAAKPTPTSQRNAGSGDSSGLKPSASSSAETTSLPAVARLAAGNTLPQAASGKKVSASLVRLAAETTVVNTQKAIYKFSNLGSVPVSIVIRDYPNRSGTGGLVQFGEIEGSLVGYRLITPTDTADLSQVPFALSRAKSANGNEILTYHASVGNHAVSIAYTIPQDTSASYVVRVDGRITGTQSPSYLITELPKSLRPTEADTIGDHRTLAYSFKPQRDHARSVLFGSLDPGEYSLEAWTLARRLLSRVRSAG